MPRNAALSCAPLFVPANRPERFQKAAASGADAIIIDLEDAVAPDLKISARAGLLPAALPAVPTLLRINSASTAWFDGDLDAAAALPVDGVILAKAETAEQIDAVRRRLPGRQVVALIESALGLANARAIARSAARLAFGSIDFCADLGCAHERQILLPVRLELVLASRLAAIEPPLDGVTTDVARPEQARDDARQAAQLGFSGKLCIHPTQIEPVLEGFRPTAEEQAWAQKILNSTEGGAELVEGAMVDAPVRLRAQRIVARMTARDRADS